MEIVKKNMLSILCGVVALAAVIAIPTFVSSQQKRLQTELNGRKDTYDKLLALKAKQRTQPIVSVDPTASSPPLEQFPSPKLIEAGEAAIKSVQDQSIMLRDLAVKMNTHNLLVAGSLPVPQDWFKFVAAYQEQFKNTIPEALNSVTPPTEQEIDRAIKAKTDEKNAAAPKDPQGEILPGMKEQIQHQIDQLNATLPEQMRQDASTKHKMYMDPRGALAVQPELASQNGVSVAPPPEVIWYAQMGLWIQQDLVQAIQDLNRNSQKVADSTVKQLVQVAISPGSEMYVMPSSAQGAAAATPGAPTSPVATNTETDALTKDFGASPTGRVCNGVFDVVQFTITLTVQASDVNKVIAAMERGRLLTVTETDVQSVNSAAMKEQGYFFGPNPVVTLTMNCEELFLRNWTAPLMPSPIKTLLNVQTPGQQPTAAVN